VIPVTHEHAQLVDFEGLQRIQDSADELGINILEIVKLELFRLDFAVGDETLMTLELLEVVHDAAVDNRHDVDDATHNIVLYEDVAFCFDDACVTTKTQLFVVDD